MGFHRTKFKSRNANVFMVVRGNEDIGVRGHFIIMDLPKKHSCYTQFRHNLAMVRVILYTYIYIYSQREKNRHCILILYK